jgi:O-antigen/teichoic acid export membrane protein
MTTASDEEAERGKLARGGLLTFTGSGVSAVMGFAFTVILARMLGDSGSGVVLQAIGIFTIALSVARLGMDSTAVWIMPRQAQGDPSALRSTALYLLGAAAAAGLVGAVALHAGATAVADGTRGNTSEVAHAVQAIAWFLPVASVLLVALSLTRGLGGLRTYVAVGSVGLPTARPILTAVVAGAGGTLAMVTLAWAIPLAPALIVAIVVVMYQVKRREPRENARLSWRASRPMLTTLNSYAAPRTISAILEQSLMWLDVIIVGAIAGSAAAGIYGGAVRLVAAGIIIDTAIRVVVSPAFSALLHQGRSDTVQSLYRTAATWLVLFSSPVYIMLAIYSPLVLSWLGESFEAGADALVVLCLGALTTLMAGNIHSVLLMSGHSGWAAVNKLVAVAINIAGNLLLVPAIGILGAALAWSISVFVDAFLASIEVRKLVGVTADLRVVAYALIVPLISFGIPGVLARVVAGPSLLALLISLLIGTVAFAAWCRFSRERLSLSRLSLLARTRRPPAA